MKIDRRLYGTSPDAAAGEVTNASHVTATLTYMVKTATKPYVHTAALTGGEPRYFAQMEDRQVTVRDARPISEGLSIDHEGFEHHRVATRVPDLYDEEQVKNAYFAEIERLLREKAGASRVVIFDHTRRTDAGRDRQGFRGPASRAHNDYTERSGPQRVRDVLGDDRVRSLDDKRIAQINVWRPIRGPVMRSPLALLDASSLSSDDLIATDHIYPDRTGEIYHLAYNPNQRWWYFPAMDRDEVVLIKGYDSLRDGRARFTPHTAFTEPTSPPDAPPRESIEVRTLAIFD